MKTKRIQLTKNLGLDEYIFEGTRPKKISPWGRYGKPDKLKEIEQTIRNHLLTGSVCVEKLACEIYFL